MTIAVFDHSLIPLYQKALIALRDHPCDTDVELAFDTPAILELRPRVPRHPGAAPSVRGNLAPMLQYDDLIEHETYERVLRHYQRILSSYGGLDRVTKLLRRYPGTKRAVLDFWTARPGHLTSEDPCLMYCWFRIAGDELRLHAHFRGNDACNKLLLNMDLLTCAQELVAEALDLRAGSYRHVSDSLHIYRHDVQRSEELERSVAAQHMSPARLQ